MAKTITASLLVDYIMGSPQRRLEIIMMKVRHHPFYNWYGAFPKPATKILMGAVPDSVISDEKLRLSHRRFSKNNNSDMKNVLDAFDLFKTIILPELRLMNYSYKSLPKHFNSSVLINGITVTSRPHALIYDASGVTPRVGSLFFYLHLHDPILSPRGRELLSAINFYVLENSGVMDAAHTPQLCYVIDVLRNQLTAAPQQYEIYKHEIEVGVAALVAQWDSVLAKRKIGG